MKTTLILLASIALASAAGAASVAFRPDGRPGVGIPYDWVVTLGGVDNATFSRHVGAWSWEDNSLYEGDEPSVGWTHTSDWVQLTLQQSVQLTLTLSREINVAGASASSPSMFPSFTIWSGWDTDGSQLHTYNNNNNEGPVWAEDLVYLDHLDNSTLTSVQRTWSLPAGNYTIVLGSNAPSTDADRQGYTATFTTIPEPSSALVVGLGSLFLLRRRRGV